MDWLVFDFLADVALAHLSLDSFTQSDDVEPLVEIGECFVDAQVSAVWCLVCCVDGPCDEVFWHDVTLLWLAFRVDFCVEQNVVDHLEVVVGVDEMFLVVVCIVDVV